MNLLERQLHYAHLQRATFTRVSYGPMGLCSSHQGAASARRPPCRSPRCSVEAARPLHPPIHLPANAATHPSIHLSIPPFLYSPVHTSIHPPTHLSIIRPSTHIITAVVVTPHSPMSCKHIIVPAGLALFFIGQSFSSLGSTHTGRGQCKGPTGQ